MMLHCYVNSMSPFSYSPSKCYHVVLSACYPQCYFNNFSHCQQEEQIFISDISAAFWTQVENILHQMETCHEKTAFLLTSLAFFYAHNLGTKKNCYFELYFSPFLMVSLTQGLAKCQYTAHGTLTY